MIKADYIKAIADDFALNFSVVNFNIFDQLEEQFRFAEDDEIIIYVKQNEMSKLSDNVYSIQNIHDNVLTEKQFKELQ